MWERLDGIVKMLLTRSASVSKNGHTSGLGAAGGHGKAQPRFVSVSAASQLVMHLSFADPSQANASQWSLVEFARLDYLIQKAVSKQRLRIDTGFGHIHVYARLPPRYIPMLYMYNVY